jgi:hypothetical protein
MESAYPMETPRTEELQIGKKIAGESFRKITLKMCNSLECLLYCIFSLEYNVESLGTIGKHMQATIQYSVKSGTVKRWSLYTLFCLNF